MPGNSHKCREHAKRCWQLASETTNPTLKTNFTRMAQTWARLATDLEATKSLLEAFGPDNHASPEARLIEKSRRRPGTAFNL
jgi:hypothetical protein